MGVGYRTGAYKNRQIFLGHISIFMRSLKNPLKLYQSPLIKRFLCCCRFFRNLFIIFICLVFLSLSFPVNSYGLNGQEQPSDEASRFLTREESGERIAELKASIDKRLKALKEIEEKIRQKQERARQRQEALRADKEKVKEKERRELERLAQIKRAQGELKALIKEAEKIREADRYALRAQKPAPAVRATPLETSGFVSPFREDRLLDYSQALRNRIIQNITYPELVKKKGLEGALYVGFRLSSDGQLKEVAITESSGHKLLDEALMVAVRKGAPYPPFPPEIGTEELWVEIPIIYKGRGVTVGPLKIPEEREQEGLQ